MPDAFWAARQGDALAHSSIMADVLGGVLEVVAGVAVGALVGAAVIGATSLTLATGGLGACVLGAVVGVAVGVGMNLTGADERISQFCENLANALFPPTVHAHISSGSSNVFINGLPAARAAGAISPGAADLPDDPAPEGTFLDIDQGFFSELWRPTVASPAVGALPKSMDQVICERHPPMPAQYIAEGSDRVFINGQPAVRSGDRSTCDATVVSSVHVSPNVRIGGDKQVVRPIRSGKTPGVGLAVNTLMIFKGGPRKFVSNLPCMVMSGINAYGVSQVAAALSRAVSGSPHPVHAATGAKVLSGAEELDVTLPGVLPIEWQRFYNSRDERQDGLFGAGWSMAFEVSVHVEPHPEGGERLTYIDEQARRIDMGTIELGSASFSAGEGLAVRRHDDGRLLIESEDGRYRLFDPAVANPSVLRLIQLGDRNDNRICLEYDAEHRLTQLYDSQRVLRVALIYSVQWPRRLERIERVYPDLNAEILASYTYDARGDLAQVRDAAGNVQRRFAYDSGRRMVEHQLPTGLRCFYAWALVDDREWRVIRHWTDDGEEYRFDYDLSAGTTQITDGLNRVSHRRWNPQRQITEYTDNLDQTWQFSWNDERQLLGAVDPQGGRWQYGYDEAGNLSSTEDPLGRCDSTSWLEHWSLPQVVTDAVGNAWQYRYDARGNCTHQADPLGHVTRYRYDERGQVIEIIDATDKRKKLRWNGLGQLIEHVDCSGYATRFSYDRRGYLRSITDATGECTTYVHDAQGRLLQSQQPDGRIERYLRNASGLLTGYVDRAGHTTTYRYDRRGRVRQRVDAHQRQVHFTLDAYSRLLALTNENGESYRFAWDAGDRLIARQDLDGSQWRYRYDALDNPVRVEHLPAPPGGDLADDSPNALVHSLERDALGRLRAKVTADGRTEYIYNPLDQLTAVTFTDPEGQQQSVGFAYDALGQLLTEQTASGILQHHYDELGNRIQTHLPDGRWLNRLHYGSGHVHQINLDGTVICDFEHDRLHREVLRTQGQISTHFRYDRSGRLRSKLRPAVGQSAELQGDREKEYDYDHTDNLISRLSRNGTHESRTLLHYDSTARIMASQDDLAGQLEIFAYDAAANVLDGSPSGAGPVRHNKLLAFQDKRYRYDAFGRLIEKRSTRYGIQHFVYDAESRLVEVHNANGNVVRMSYDPLGRRIGKSERSQTGTPLSETRFTWDGLRLLQEFSNSQTSLYVYADGYDPLARVDSNDNFQYIRYYHNDPNGLPEQLTEADGLSVWQARYQVWGKTVEEHRKPHFTVEQNLRFQGQYLDRETGLHYNTFRFYDPDVGRFTTPDPIGLAGGLNLYQYAPNPIGWVDPWGWSCTVVNARNRRHAYSLAKNHAQVPRLSRGGDIIDIDRVNDSSRGENWNQMKLRGARSVGREHKDKGVSYFEHPDGHPDAGKPGIPKHHESGHIHAVNSKGEQIVFTW
ncbi:RHS repeat-associated core domain-containing protein [Pseudomonas bohemica]|uniref:RHS repeat-associated core domain-containing protein n=1 Tax=Pseudomonas bohemica TaxID=2044872 RepID=UPI000DA61612|nr:RHS repeat-associated core domain-containing protein [Pseudomonas bohemica]